MLIDPAVLTIDSGAVSYGNVIGTNFIEGVLDANTNLTLWANDSIIKTAGATSVVATGFGDLRLAIGTSDGSLREAVGNIVLPEFEIDIAGNFNASAGTMTGSVTLGKVAANNVAIFAGATAGDITLNTGGISAASTDITLQALGGNITIGTAVLPGNVVLTGGTFDDIDIDIDAGLDVVISGDLIASASGATGGSGSYGGSARVDVQARNFTARDVKAYAGNTEAAVFLSAVDGIAVRNVEAEIGITGSGGGSGWASIDLTAGIDITANNLEAVAGSISGSANIILDAGNNIIVNDVTAIAAGTKDARISFDASNDISANNTVATANGDGDAWISFSADNDIVTNNTVATANGNGDAEIDFWASSGNVIANNITAITNGTGSASIDVSAGNDIIANNTVATANGNGDAWISFSAGNDIVTNNTVATANGSGDASIEFWASSNVTANDVTAIANGGSDVSIEIYASSGNVTVNNLTAIANGSGGEAWISVSAGNDATVNNVTATANSGSAAIELWADNNLVVNGITTAVAANELTISYSASNTVTVNGAINATQVGTDSYAEIEIWGRNGVTVNAPINAVVAGASGWASVDINAPSGNVVTQAITAVGVGSSANIEIDAGGTITVNGDLRASGGSWASIELDAANINVNGNVNALAAGGSSKARANINYWASSSNVVVNGATTAVAPNGRASISMFASGNVVVNGPITASGQSAMASLSGVNVNANGNVNLTAASFASFYVEGAANVSVTGDVTINEAGGGSAVASYVYFGDGVFGKHTITAGPGGFAFAGFGGSSGSSAKSATFLKPVVVNGGSGDSIGAWVQNSIVTTGTGILAADQVSLRVSNTGNTVINAATKTPLVLVQNTGFTPDVRIDNRAFIGPSTINIGGGGGPAVLDSATFFATGPLSFNGAFSAHRLAVGVTNGSVTFNSPVNITGENPFLPTAPDIALFNILSERGLSPPLHGPNVQILAQNGISITNTFNVGGPSPFTKMFTNGPFNISGLTTSADNLLAVFSPIDTTRAIFFENLPLLQPLGASGFFNIPTVSGLPNNAGTTVVFGETGPATAPLLSGAVTIGSSGAIDIGDRNMFIISRGAVTGDELVTTTGIFEIIGLAVASFFETPVLTEFGEDDSGLEEEEEEDDEALALEEGGEGEEGGDVEESSSSESMECSA